MAEDVYENQVDPPMEIHIVVEDVNDNAPVCEQEETVFEVQEGEPVGETSAVVFCLCASRPST